MCCVECERTTKEEGKSSRRSRRRTWVAAVLCLVVAGLLGWGLYNRSMADEKLTSLAHCEGGIYTKEIGGPDWFKEWVKKYRLPVPGQPVHFASSIITDADMKYVARAHTLRGITLVKCSVTDAGMMHLRKMSNVTKLNLNATLVSDKTLEYISKMADLKDLHLHKTAVTDAGLAHLVGLKKLQFLGLGRTSVTDKGAGILTNIESLRFLDLGRTQVTDAALEKIAKMRNLQGLYLFGTNVTDEGLRHLTSLDSLLEIDVSQTDATAEVISELKGAIPKLNIMK